MRRDFWLNFLLDGGPRIWVLKIGLVGLGRIFEPRESQPLTLGARSVVDKPLKPIAPVAAVFGGAVKSRSSCSSKMPSPRPAVRGATLDHGQGLAAAHELT
jgi:hypothetical protein